MNPLPLTYRAALRWLIVGTLVASSASGWAQDEAEPVADESAQDDEARVEYLRGERLYAEGQYEEAVEAFDAAYRLSGRPALLFNLANTYERLARYEEALAALQRYAPDAPAHQVSTVNVRIENLETRLREQDEERRLLEAQRAATTQSAQPIRPSDPTPAQSSPAEPTGPGVGRPVGITLVAVGLAAVAGGVASAFLASSSHDDLVAGCPSGVCPSSLNGTVDSEARRALAADILLIGGGAMVLGGVLAWALAGKRPADDTGLRVNVTPRAGGLGGEFVGTF